MEDGQAGIKHAFAVADAVIFHVAKNDYAASVQRLVRDGVDSLLVNLFVHAARSVAEGAEGANRARSATEAFLYRRLQSLSETSGRFRLNAELPIAFDG